MSTRFTHTEEDALLTALAQVLAGEVLDGYGDYEDDPEARKIRAAMQRAQEKLWNRKEKRKQ
jgi:hypothetical protein